MIPEPRPGSMRPGLMLLASLVGLVVLAVPKLRKQRSARPKKGAERKETAATDPWLRRAEAPGPRGRLTSGQKSGGTRARMAQGAAVPGSR